MKSKKYSPVKRPGFFLTHKKVDKNHWLKSKMGVKCKGFFLDSPEIGGPANKFPQPIFQIPNRPIVWLFIFHLLYLY